MTTQIGEELKVVAGEGVNSLVLNRQPLNVLNIDFMWRFKAALEDPATIHGARVLSLRSEGKAFCAGVDVADHTAERTREMLQLFHEVILLLRNMSVPTVAVVKRAALGGGMELALACDLVLASAQAKFGIPEITLGVFPPVAVAWLPGIIGQKRAAELIFTGTTITAADAERYGIVNAVFDDEEFQTKCDAYLEKLSKLSGAALKETKRALLDVAGESDRQKALKLAEVRYLTSLMATHDASEGIQAFTEKRTPLWAHR
jgi:cyclohexa-1,5-dienecarbonyl-CoA hydratase